MGKKKAFIDKKSAKCFRLVPESAMESSKANKFAPSKEHLEEQHKFGIYFDDDYDYMQHLRAVDEKMALEEVGKEKVEEKRSLIRVPYIPPPLFSTNKKVDFVDDDVERALEGDMSVVEAGNLEDDFVAMAGGALDDRVMSFRSRMEFDEDDDEEDNEDEECGEYEDEENDDDSLSARRTGEQRDIDQIFDMVMEREYDDNEQLGELDGDDFEVGGVLDPSDGRLKRLAAEMPKNPDYDEQIAKEFVRQRMRLIEQGIIKETEETEEVEVEESSSKRTKWDCESFASRYSNVYNHPTLIRENRGGLSRKNLKFLDKVAEKMDLEEDEDAMDDDDVSQCTSASTFRPKGETPEQRRLRKQAVKESRRARRQEKKANKTAFATETRKMAKGRIGQIKGVPLP